MSSAHYHQLAYYQETTQGTGPANAAAWLAAVASGIASGGRIAPLAGTLDPNSIGPSVLDDERVQDDIFDDEGDLIGINNPEFGFETYAETAGTATADGVQIVLTAQMKMAEHALGGLHRGTTRTVTGAGPFTTTSFDLDSVGGLAVGCHVALELANYTGLGGASVCHVRRVIAISGTTVTIDEPLPVAPVANDLARACATAYIDSTVLEDSDGAGGPYTLSWLVSRGPVGGDATWEVVGSKAQIESLSFERDNFGKIVWKIMGGGGRLPHQAPSPVWVSGPANEPPFQVGRLTRLWLADYGAAGASVGANAFSVDDTGVPVVSKDAITTDSAGMEGRCGYTTTRADTTATLTLCHHDADNWADFLSRGYKAVRHSILATAGNGFAVGLPRCQIANLPEFADVNSAAHNTLKLKGFRDTSGVGSSQLARSKLVLVWY